MAEVKMSKEEQIGFHKGSLNTLAKEREELVKMISVVEQLMQLHIQSLKELGIDLEAEAKKVYESMKKVADNKKDKSNELADKL
ncbi:hypothetical protein HYX19_00805 [Candidatus Woesearchaeota archaeon]|nr:hypothetical protein [Candidatus Woesearchaeota archaeon]